MRSIPFLNQGPSADSGRCMDVWGGHATTERRFRRPGIDVWVWSQSQGLSHAGGGELHLISSCASGRITRILMADVCGFGGQFAQIAGDLRKLMKRNLNSNEHTRLVGHLSHHLADASQRGAFASILLGTYLSATRSFRFCSAGHPPPLFFRAATNEWSVLTLSANVMAASAKRVRAIHAPLGVVDPAEYQQRITQLAEGDMVLSYSNALTECLANNGRMLGVDGLLNLVRKLDCKCPEKITGGLVAAIRRQHFKNLVDDDATLLLCRATTTPVSWQDNLLAPLRLLRSFVK